MIRLDLKDIWNGVLRVWAGEPLDPIEGGLLGESCAIQRPSKEEYHGFIRKMVNCSFSNAPS